jgi:hypothetical protein
VSADVFVFVSRTEAPTEAELRSVLSSMERVYVEVDVPAADMTFEPGEVEYVEAVVGPFRLDTITYHGGTLRHVADLLDRCYSQVTALADNDADGIFPIPELVHLMRSHGEPAFHSWADPAKRR